MTNKIVYPPHIESTADKIWKRMTEMEKIGWATSYLSFLDWLQSKKEVEKTKEK